MEHGQDGLNCAAYNQNLQSNKVCLAPSLQIRCDRHLSECNNWSSPVFTSILQLEWRHNLLKMCGLVLTARPAIALLKTKTRVSRSIQQGILNIQFITVSMSQLKSSSLEAGLQGDVMCGDTFDCIVSNWSRYAVSSPRGRPSMASSSLGYQFFYRYRSSTHQNAKYR